MPHPKTLEIIHVNHQMPLKHLSKCLYLKVTKYGNIILQHFNCFYCKFLLFYFICYISIDRQSEPLLRPDAKDHSSSIIHLPETSSNARNINSDRKNVYPVKDSNNVGDDTFAFSSSSTSTLLNPLLQYLGKVSISFLTILISKPTIV